LAERKMSYINDALRKAQRERNGRYERFGGIIASGPEAPRKPRKRLAAGAALALVVLSAVGVFLAVSLQWPSSAKKYAPRLVVAGDPAGAPASPVPVAGNEAPDRVSAGAAPGSTLEEKTTVTGKGPPATERPGEKTAAAAASAGASGHAVEVGEWFRDALLAQRRGDIQRAEDLYQKVLTRDPGHVKALNNLGVIYMGRKNREKAIAVFGRAIAIKKDYVDPYYNLACLYAQTNEVDESLRYLKVAMAINSDVKNWAAKDADLRSIVASPAFKKIREGQEN
jgi:tetratricopeptide (TPR) repeat protein